MIAIVDLLVWALCYIVLYFFLKGPLGAESAGWAAMGIMLCTTTPVKFEQWRRRNFK